MKELLTSGVTILVTKTNAGYIILGVLGESLCLIFLFHVAFLGTTSSGWARHFVSSGLVRHFVVHRVLFYVLCRVPLVVPAGFTHEPPGVWQHINYGFTVMRLNFMFQTLRWECVGYRLFQCSPWCERTSVCFDFVFAEMASCSLV